MNASNNPVIKKLQWPSHPKWCFKPTQKEHVASPDDSRAILREQLPPRNCISDHKSLKFLGIRVFSCNTNDLYTNNPGIQSYSQMMNGMFKYLLSMNSNQKNLTHKKRRSSKEEGLWRIRAKAHIRHCWVFCSIHCEGRRSWSWAKLLSGCMGWMHTWAVIISPWLFAVYRGWKFISSYIRDHKDPL